VENTTFTGMTFTDEPDLVAEGEYEFVIDSADKKKSKAGTSEFLSLKLKIRTDVPQAHQGRILFLTVFKDKDRPEWYDFRTLKTIIQTQKVTYSDGRKWSVSFETPDDCIQYLIGLKLRASVIHETYDNGAGDGGVKASIVKSSFKPTAVVSTSATTTSDTVETPNLSDDSLPF